MNEIISYKIARPLGTELHRYQTWCLYAGIAGLAACALGAFFSPDQFFRSYLVGYFFWTGLALGCLALVMLQHLSGGAWGVMIRRPLESATRTLPVMALLFIPVIVAVLTGSLYQWAKPGAAHHDAVIAAKSGYLNAPFFIARSVLYFVIWLTLMLFLNRWSKEQDRTGSLSVARRMEAISGPGLVLYVFTMTFAAVDWLMSLDPHWFSTIYGFMAVCGQGLSAFAFIIAVIVLLANRAPLNTAITKRHLHDLGKLMLAFVMLWAYMSFSQLIIIWSGNLPEEITWYMARLNGGWQYIALFLLLFHFTVPFLLLLSQDFKKNPRVISSIALWVIFVRMVDVFWLIEPNFNRTSFHLSWLDFASLIGVGGIFLACFLWQLPKLPLLPFNAPNFQKALEHGRHH